LFFQGGPTFFFKRGSYSTGKPYDKVRDIGHYTDKRVGYILKPYYMTIFSHKGPVENARLFLEKRRFFIFKALKKYKQPVLLLSIVICKAFLGEKHYKPDYFNDH